MLNDLEYHSLIIMRLIKQLFVILVLSILIWLGYNINLEAQVTTENNEQMQLRQELLQQLLQEEEEALENASEGTNSSISDSGNNNPIHPPPPPIEIPDQHPAEEAYLAALKEYYAYRISGLQHRSQVFQWQFFSSKVIFVTVLALVFLGIYFAAIQFHIGLRRKGKMETTNEEKQTELVVSTKEIKVSSSVLGVIILVISLAFFYLYLIYVYPIEEIF